MGRAKRTLAIVAFTLVSCSSQIVPAATPTTNTALLRLYTTTATVPLANDLTTTYSQWYPTIAFDVTAGNYESMVEQVEQDEDAYLISNHLPTESVLLGFPVGQDGIAVIVNRENDIPNLTTEQLREIYQGRVANWRELGGDEQPLVVMSREDGSGTRAEFERLVMGERHTTRAAQIAPSSAAMVESVSRTPGAIGYVSISYLNASVRAVPVNGILPTIDHVMNNRYPLRSTLFIIGQREPQGMFRAFVGWLQSPTGQTIVARHHAPLTQP